MARAIDADALKEKYADMLSVQHLFGYDAGFVDGIRAALEMSTLTPPNEPLTCEGCIHEEKEHQNCNYCMRASYLGDYYYRRPPEGEEGDADCG